jgi:hypothetical protein
MAHHRVRFEVSTQPKQAIEEIRRLGKATLVEWRDACAELKAFDTRCEEGFEVPPDPSFRPSSDVQRLKQQKITNLATQVQQKREANNSRYIGGWGYTGPNIQAGAEEEKRIKTWETSENAKIDAWFQEAVKKEQKAAAVEAARKPLLEIVRTRRAEVDRLKYLYDKECDARNRALLEQQEIARGREAAIRKEMERLAILKEAQERYEQAERKAAERARLLREANERARAARAEEAAKAAERAYYERLQKEIDGMIELGSLD